MIAMDCPRKIEEFYEAYKDVRHAAWLCLSCSVLHDEAAGSDVRTG